MTTYTNYVQPLELKFKQSLPDKFDQVYGTGFVSQIKYGASLVVLATFETNDERVQMDIQASLEAGIGIDNFGVSAEVGAQYNKSTAYKQFVVRSNVN